VIKFIASNISDLSESGKIEETASRVFLLYRDEYYNPDSEDVGIAEMSLAKNRFGQTGTSRMSFLKEYTSFEDMYYV
jgi:replicative DNA helicase